MSLAKLPTDPSEFDESEIASDIVSNERRTRRWMRPVHKMIGITAVVVHRMWYHMGLSLLAIFGVVLAVGLVTSASFFAQAVDTVMLRREMTEYTAATGRPPFFARVFSPSTVMIPLSLNRVEVLGAQIADTYAREVGLPVRQVTYQANSGKLELRSPEDEYGHDAEDVNVMAANDVAQHMTVLEGIEMGDGASSDRLDLWVHRNLVDETGLQLGEQYNLATSGELTVVPAYIAGVWIPTDAGDSYWMSDPDRTLGDKLLVRENDYVSHIQPLLNHKVRSATWQVVLDENAVVPANARDYVDGYSRAEVVVGSFLPDAHITTPTVSLDTFVDRQSSLTTLLLGFNLPGLGFLLYFLILTSIIIAYWQRREMLVMLSRGMSRLDVLNFTLVDAVLLFLLGLPFGLGLGVLLARVMGYASSFLNFDVREALPVSWHGISLPLIAVTFAVLLIAKVWATMLGNWRSLAAQSGQHYRPVQAPFWYRSYLDLILLIPAWYAYQQLLKQGSLAMMVQDRPEELYQDPLLVLAPALFVVVMALVSMRVFRAAMFVLDHFARWVKPMSIHMAMRQLGRHSHTYINPLLLVVVSLALGVYTLSMAASLDQWLADRIYYRTGADIAFEPLRETDLYMEASSAAPSGEWIPPIDEFTALPGVEEAARVGNYPAEIRLATGNLGARFVGVDRIDFDKVAWFRNDFAPESLGALMNRLATAPQNVLVSLELLEENALRIGDPIVIDVFPEAGARLQDNFIIAGIYEYFPTSEPDEVIIIGNLEHLFSFFGITMPHDIWMRLDSEAEGQAVFTAVDGEMHLETLNQQNAQAILREEQAKMERVGVFGTLSVSFVAATVMAALGLLTYTYASLQERRQQFAVLRAVGLYHGQVVRQVAVEYTILMIFGAMAGIVIGTMAATMFVPLFRVASGQAPDPPLIPIVAINEIIPLVASFIAVMLVAELIIIGMALKGRLFTALRM